MSTSHLHDWDSPLPLEVPGPGEWIPLVEVIEAPDPVAQNLYVVKCPRGEHRVGLLAHDGHLVYRMHASRGATGRTLTCSASLRAVHDVPPPTRPDITCHRKGTHHD